MSTVSRVFGRIKPFVGTRVRLESGERVKVKVRRDLLSPVGKDVAAVLQINGTKVFIPRGRDIKVGRGKDSDIRINDPAVSSLQFIITSSGDQIHVLAGDSTTGIIDSKTEENTILACAEERAITHEVGLSFLLSGVSGEGDRPLLEFKLTPSGKSAELLRTAMQRRLNEAAARPTVEQVSPEQALVHQAGALAVSGEEEITTFAVRGTVFEGIKTVQELFARCGDIQRKSIEETRWPRRVGNFLLFGGVSTAVLNFIFAFALNSSSAIYFGIVLLPIIFLGFKMCMRPLLFYLAQGQLKEALVKIIQLSKTDVLAQLIFQLSGDWQKYFLDILSQQNQAKAFAVHQKLAELRSLPAPTASSDATVAAVDAESVLDGAETGEKQPQRPFQPQKT